MANSVLTIDTIAKTAVMILENNLHAAKNVYRGYEGEFTNKINGYQVGDTISIKRPTDFTVTDGRVLSTQDVVEGSLTMAVDRQKHIGFEFTSAELTLDIRELAERVIKPAMIQLANRIDADLMALYSDVANWVGTPGQTIDSFTDLAKAPERMTEFGVPYEDRSIFMPPADYWAMLGSQTGLLHQALVGDAWKNGKLGQMGGIMPYETQNAPTHTTGTFAGTTLVDATITSATTTYASVKDTMTQTIHVDGFTAAAPVVKQGDVFTIAGVYAVNPVSKAQLPFLKQFTVTADATGATNEVDLIVSPALIWSGAFQNVSVSGVSDLDNQAVTFMGSQSTSYRQNLAFHKNAFALAMVPLQMPAGAVNASRQNYKGCSVRMIPIYDGTNDISKYRLDVLYGVKTIDPRLATRVSGTA